MQSTPVANRSKRGRECGLLLFSPETTTERGPVLDMQVCGRSRAENQTFGSSREVCIAQGMPYHSPMQSHQLMEVVRGMQLGQRIDADAAPPH